MTYQKPKLFLLGEAAKLVEAPTQKQISGIDCGLTAVPSYDLDE